MNKSTTNAMYFIHNHFPFLVKYNKDAHTDLARIVAFEVEPYRFDIHPLEWKFLLNFCHDARCNLR
uniref:Uncharacterized protein n=1 Tax=Arundo donax TaxID=35708 RepID=A0A0A9G7H0_ARUDO